MSSPGTGAQKSFGGPPKDAFVARLTPSLTNLLQSTYLGAGASDIANGIAIHPTTGEIYVSGNTFSTGTTFPGVSGGARPVFALGGDAFISRFSLDLLAADVVPDALGLAAQAPVPANTLRTSAPVAITGIAVPANVSVSGALGSALCVSSAEGCACDATPGNAFTATPAPISNNQFLCVRHVSAPVTNALRETVVIVGGSAAKFQTFTGSNLTTCSLDVDGNGIKDALTDGLIILRALFGLTGTAVTSGGAVGPGATRSSWTALQSFLNSGCGTSFL